MSFAWQEFVELAGWLVTERPDEAAQRTAISRAYYAAYHTASAYVRAHELAAPGQHLTHQLVWRLIRDSGKPNSGAAASLGDILRKMRVRADYWNPYPGDITEVVVDAITTSNTIIALLRAM